MARIVAVMALLGLAGVAAAQAPAASTLKVKARIVAIDVVVTDQQGKPVKNLRASDFSLAENGAPQKIDHFEVHTSLSVEDAAKLPPMPKLEPNIFTNYSPVPANGALNVLLLDELNTHYRATQPMKNQSIVRQQMLKYLAIPHPGVQMEIFKLNDGLNLMQGFTSDPEVLRAALTNRKEEPQVSRLVPNPAFDPDGLEIGNTDSESTSAGTGVATSAALSAASIAMAGAMTEGSSQELRFRSLSTLDAMAALARYMGGLPGRKNLLWFSASFAIPPGRGGEVAQKLRETMALFAKNQVAVYPIAASGLAAGPVEKPRMFLNTVDDEYSTMERMAEDTGGKVFKNTNDLASAVQHAIDDGSNYYTLTYTPANRDWKGEFRKVEVKLAQAGYTLAYRPGYYAEDFDKPSPTLAAMSDSAPSKGVVSDAAKAVLHAAMEYGSPQPTDIVLKAEVTRAAAGLEAVAARGNSLSPKVSGPFERYVLSIVALPTAFTFTRSTAGKVHMAAQLATCVYAADGALMNVATFKVEGDLDEEHYKSIMANGLKFQQEISVPAKGESFLRIGVEDLATSRVGVVEIPVAMVPSMKPQARSAAVAAK